jgi:hypothetical protein
VSQDHRIADFTQRCTDGEPDARCDQKAACDG